MPLPGARSAFCHESDAGPRRRGERAQTPARRAPIFSRQDVSSLSLRGWCQVDYSRDMLDAASPEELLRWRAKAKFISSTPHPLLPWTRTRVLQSVLNTPLCVLSSSSSCADAWQGKLYTEPTLFFPAPLLGHGRRGFRRVIFDEIQVLRAVVESAVLALLLPPTLCTIPHSVLLSA